MDHQFDFLSDCARRGADAVLRFTSGLGDKLRTASNTAIDKLDSIQLEKKLSRLYMDLGDLSYRALLSGRTLSADNDDVRPKLAEIEEVVSELEKRKANECDPEKGNKK